MLSDFLIFGTSFSQGTAIRDRIQESLRGQPAEDYKTSSGEEDDYGDDDEYYYDNEDLNAEEEYYETDVKSDAK